MPLPKDPVDYRLVTTLSELNDYWDQYEKEVDEKVVALDTEASGLNVRIATVAGASLSIVPGTGVYVPINHILGPNMPQDILIDFLYQKEVLGWKYLFYNAKYDLGIMETNFKWWPRNYLDVLELVYLANSDRLDKKLKSVAEIDMSFNMTKFEELFTPEEVKAKNLDITSKDPKKCRDYATADADATLRIYQHPPFNQIQREYAFAVKVDTALIEIVRRMEYDGGLELRDNYIESELKRLKAVTDFLGEQICKIAGVDFKVNSPKRLGEVLFDKMGIPNDGVTESGQYKTDAETLDKLKLNFPIIEYVITYRKISTAQSAYFKKFKRLVDEKIEPRFNFNMYSVPTFRFAAPGGDPNKEGAMGVNVQAISNGDVRSVWGVELGQINDITTLEDDENIDIIQSISDQPIIHGIKSFPYVFDKTDGSLACIKDTCDNCPENCASKGINITREWVKDIQVMPSVKQVFQAPRGYTILSIDYVKQEILIAANISGERIWLDALLNNVDIHAVTGAAAHGLQTLDGVPKLEAKKMRDIGKTLNFAVFFGATERSLAKKVRITEQAAKKIYWEFKKNMSTLMAWIARVHAFSKRNGYTTTYFGRKRWLKQFYDRGDRKWEAYANRSAVSTCIQGTGADVIRIAMVKVAKWANESKLPINDFRSLMTIHDEMVFMVRDELLHEIAPHVKRLSEFEVSGWEAPLTVTLKEGKTWGLQKELNL